MNLSQLKWHCRRGTRELDLLLTQYLEHIYPQAPAIEQQTFQQLLTLTNEELSDYLFGKTTPAQPEMLTLVQKIQKFT